MTAGDRDYARRLGDVLRQRDPALLRAFLVEQAERFGDERQVAEIRDRPADDVEMLLHRMIVARADLADLHPESERWLAAHGGGPGSGPPLATSRRRLRGHQGQGGRRRHRPAT